MFQVQDIEADVKRVLGGCTDEEFYSRLNHAVEILSTESDWDPLVGYIDVCACGDRYVTLPKFVGTVLSVSIDGTPAQAHDRWWKAHLNGPGANFTSINYHWVDGFEVCTYREPPRTGSLLGVSIEQAADAGKKFRVYGYDVNGNWIRSANSAGLYEDGWPIPLVLGSVYPGAAAPAFRKITRISKDITLGMVNLFTVDTDSQTYTFLGQYQPREKEPSYRRIQLSSSCAWARIMFKKSEVELLNPDDLVPLHSKYALVLMVKALKKLDEDRIDEAEAYQKKAVQLLTKKQLSLSPPTAPTFQVADGNLLSNKGDRLD